MMMLPTGLPPSESSRLATFVSPRRNRRWRMTTSCVSSRRCAPRMQTPSPGAVWPAMVMYGARMRMRFFRWIVPATLNTTIRGPDGVARLAERAGAGVVEAGDDVHLPAAAAEAVHAAAPRPGERRDRRLRQVRRLRRAGDVRLALLRPRLEFGLRLRPRLVLGLLVGGAPLVLGLLHLLRHLRVLPEARRTGRECRRHQRTAGTLPVGCTSWDTLTVAWRFYTGRRPSASSAVSSAHSASDAFFMS